MNFFLKRHLNSNETKRHDKNYEINQKQQNFFPE